MISNNKIEKVRGFDVWLLVGATNTKVHRALNKRLNEVGLSLAQHEILMAIYLKPGATQNEVADTLLAVKSNVSTHLSKLEKKGLILRETDGVDTRVKRLSLSREGNKLVQTSFEIQSEFISSMVSEVSAKELEMLETVMKRVSVGLDEIIESP